jgi:hypothetical protein
MRTLAHALDEAGNRYVEPCRAFEDFVALCERWPAAAAHEIVEGRLARGEGVGLVLEPADCDSHDGLPQVGLPEMQV